MIPKIKKTFVFVYPDFEYLKDQKGVRVIPGGWYSEGIAQLAAVIEKNGWQAKLLHYPEPVDKVTFIKNLKNSQPDIIGFSVRSNVWPKAKEMIAWAKKLNKFLIVGSYHPTLWPKEVINWPGVNAICLGEGENPVTSLLKAFPDIKKIKSIGSLWIRNEKNQIIKNPVQPLICDLNKLPLPKFEIFDLNKLQTTKIHAATIILTRGCPYNCTYCWNNYARSLYPNKQFYVRYRSPKNSLAYIKKYLKTDPQLYTFRFQDDLWPFWTNWFKNFSELYIQKINKRFECHLRANLLTEAIIKRLKEMNCAGLYFGVESGNDFIRNQILKRNMTQEAIINAFSLCHKYKIRTHAYNIVGIPKETMKTVLDTIKLNAKINPTDMFYFVFYPYAGTELSRIAIENHFYDPDKPLDPFVNIEMPNFKKPQIYFASLYAKTFTRLYQQIFRMPDKLSKILEKILDFLWLFPHHPFWLLNGVMVTYKKMEDELKRFIKAHFFKLYLLLKK